MSSAIWARIASRTASSVGPVRFSGCGGVTASLAAAGAVATLDASLPPLLPPPLEAAASGDDGRGDGAPLLPPLRERGLGSSPIPKICSASIPEPRTG